MTRMKVLRFSLTERVVHWMTALSFVYAALSGLALSGRTCSGSPALSAEARRFAAGIPGAASFSPSPSASCSGTGRRT